VWTRHRLGRRMHQPAIIEREAGHWTAERNAAGVGVDWQFTTDDARVHLQRLSSKLMG